MRKLSIKRVEMFLGLAESYGGGFMSTGLNKYNLGSHLFYIRKQLHVKKDKDIERIMECLKFIMANRETMKLLAGEPDPFEGTVGTIGARGMSKSSMQLQYQFGYTSLLRPEYVLLDDIQA